MSGRILLERRTVHAVCEVATRRCDGGWNAVRARENEDDETEKGMEGEDKERNRNKIKMREIKRE